MKNNYVIKVFIVLFLTVTSFTGFSQDLIDPEPTIYVPNSFTPNYDGYNDVWQVHGIGIESIEIIIVNKWGKTIFMSSDINAVWDGSNSQSDYFVQNEIYTYAIKWKPINRQIQVLYGNISIIR